MNPQAQPSFVHRHVVCFEETNLVGNVYFARHVAWQGACREMFLRAHAPDILDALARDLRLVTVNVSCEYFEELRAFDEVALHMTLAFERHGRIGLRFDYRVTRDAAERQAARGRQEIACMVVGGDGSVRPCPTPEGLRIALSAYGGSQP